MRTLRSISICLALVAPACAKNPVIITYAQRLNFEVFDADPAGQPHQTSGGATSVFYIKSIKNPAAGKTFHFKPTRLYFGSDTHNSGWNVSWAYKVAGVPWRAEDKTVDPGQTAQNLGCVVVPLALDQAGAFAYFLNYDSSVEGDSVLLSREGEAQANVANPGTVYPETLASHCNP
jgi:hypothetical protein